MTPTNPPARWGPLVVLLRAFRATAPSKARRASAERASRPAVEVTSDFGIAPSFPGMR